MEEITRRNFLKAGSLTLGGAVGLTTPVAIAADCSSHSQGAFQGVDDILKILKKLKHLHQAFPVNQLEHALQTATNARRAGEGPELIVAALCHDMGKVISVFNHETIAAEMLKPYLSDNIYQMMKYHGIFQGRFFWDKIGRDPNTYLKFKGKPWYDLTMKFTERYDSPAFKINFKTDSLESFIPELRQVMEK